MATWEKNERVSGFHSWLDERWYGLVWPQVDGSGWSWNIIDTGRAPRRRRRHRGRQRTRPRGSPGRRREQVARSRARHPLVIRRQARHAGVGSIMDVYWAVLPEWRLFPSVHQRRCGKGLRAYRLVEVRSSCTCTCARTG